MSVAQSGHLGYMKGKHHSKESIRKISEGIKNSEKFRLGVIKREINNKLKRLNLISQ